MIRIGLEDRLKMLHPNQPSAPASGSLNFQTIDSKLNEISWKLDVIVEWILEKFGDENGKFGNGFCSSHGTGDGILGPETHQEQTQLSGTGAKPLPSVEFQENYPDFEIIKIDNHDEEEEAREINLPDLRETDPLGVPDDDYGDEYEHEIQEVDPELDPLFEDPAAPVPVDLLGPTSTTTTCPTCFHSYDPLAPLPHKCQRPYSCPICTKSFPKPSKLKRHYTAVHKIKEEPPSSFPTYSCGLCGKGYSVRTSLSRHFRVDHQEHRYKCTICDKVFGQGYSLRRHLRGVHGVENPESVAPAPEVDVLQEKSPVPVAPEVLHELSAAPAPAPKLRLPVLIGCTLCPAKFQSEFRLHWHLKLKHSEKNGPNYRPKKHRNPNPESLISCTTCTGTFKDFSSFRIHQNIKKEGSSSIPAVCAKSQHRYLCPVPNCTKSFRLIDNLAKHKLNHSQFRPYGPCPVCSETFLRANHFKKHQLTHLEKMEPLFKCGICGKGCNRKDNLQQHIKLVHNGESVRKPKPKKPAPVPEKTEPLGLGTKRFTCGICGKGINRKDNLQQHIKMVHNGETRKKSKNLNPKPVACEPNNFCSICNRHFTQVSSLNRHLRTVHKDSS